MSLYIAWTMTAQIVTTLQLIFCKEKERAIFYIIIYDGAARIPDAIKDIELVNLANPQLRQI